MDPFTAFAAAQAAIKGIQAAIKMGKDINGIMHDVIGFMDAKDAVQTAKGKGKGAKSDTGKALEIAMHAKTLADQEQELKEMLIYSGNGDVWERMLQERAKIRIQRQKEELAAKKKKEAFAKELDEIVTWTLSGVAIVVFVGLVAWGIVEYTNWRR